MQNQKAVLVVLMENPKDGDLKNAIKFIKKDKVYWEDKSDPDEFINSLSYYNNSQVSINHFRSEIQEIYRGDDIIPNFLYMTHVFTAEDLVHFSSHTVKEIEEWLNNKVCHSPINDYELNTHIIDTLEMVKCRWTKKEISDIPSLWINVNLIDGMLDGLDPSQYRNWVKCVKTDNGLSIVSTTNHKL